MSKQQERQNAVRLVTGTAYNYSDDWHALFDADGIAEGPFNERMRNWINAFLGTSYLNVNDAMRMFAIDQGFTRWAEMGDFIIGARILLSSTSVNDNASVGDLVGLMSVDGGTGTYTFSITSDPDSKFVIDGVDNTRLELENTIRFYTGTAHNVTISATNGVDPAITRTFQIAVNPVVGPTFTSSANPTVDENAAFSLTLTTDEPSTFSIVGGADADLFDLTGAGLDASAFDFELPLDADFDNVYEFTVRATSAASGLTTDLAMTLTVNNVSDGGVSANAIEWGSANEITWGAANEITWGA